MDLNCNTATARALNCAANTAQTNTSKEEETNDKYEALLSSVPE
jgi:hypothetical protein